MTIKKRLARSNLMMLIIPVLIAGILLVIGMAAALFLLQTVYLPSMGLTLRELHQTGEQIEALLSGLETFACIYAGAVVAALLIAIALTNLFLTRGIFRHISEPLDTLTAGVARIRDGDLESPIDYAGEDEFKPACDAVDEMAARLKNSLDEQLREQQKKQELIVGISHDLKSPLTSIRAYTEALLEDVAGDDETRLRYLNTIHAREADIEAMVTRLLDLAKTDVSEYPLCPERLDLREAIEKAAAAFAADDLELRLEIPPELTVTADSELLGRIVSNLLGNSRKYAHRERLCVCISAEKSGDMAIITFSDNGDGVSEAQLPRIFDAFYRGDASRTLPGCGNGLGLAIVKKSVDAMGGSVHAENGEHGGLKIIFTLPIAKEEEHG